MTPDDDRTRTGRQRLIEGWLPLAQDANQQYGWQLDGPALEALIIAAAPSLADTQTALAARAVLWQVYHRQEKEAV
jgi:hypothetical protein